MKRDYEKAFRELAAEAAKEGIIIHSVKFHYTGVRALGDAVWSFGAPEVIISATIASVAEE